MNKFMAFSLIPLWLILISADWLNVKTDFRIRTITAGISLHSLSDTLSLIRAIEFLKDTRAVYTDAGYEVQTIRVSTQSLHTLIDAAPDLETLRHLKRLDQIAVRENISLSIGELIRGNQNPDLVDWVIQLTSETKNINYSIPIASEEFGIHDQAILVAAQICGALAQNSEGGEANFRFTATANCPAGIPFFPAAYHEGENSFAIGMESPNLLARVFSTSNWENAENRLIYALETAFKPVEEIAQRIAIRTQWKYDGIDTSPAPGLDASIGYAIEELTEKPFGTAKTLSACSIITSALKGINLKRCGYSGLMLPVIEDKVLAKRAMEDQYSVEELLLFSSVSGTGLDVVPIPGNTPLEVIEGVYRDVAALSLKYSKKALSVRLFPIPGKRAGELVGFDNPYLTESKVMGIE